MQPGGRAGFVAASSTAVLLVLLGAAYVLHASLVLVLVVALGVPALVVLLRLPARVSVTAAVTVAAYFAAAPFKAGGQFEIADVFLAVAAVLLFLKGRDHDAGERPASPAVRGLLIGLALIIAGGLVGGFFEPGGPVYTLSVGYQGSPLLFLPARVADLL
ncbi:MAG: hypothetical protein JO265_13290, partial [Acidimicrobiia bacterium]|nr:hypothetical protein [Acidimicrobiia bacterium]